MSELKCTWNIMVMNKLYQNEVIITQCQCSYHKYKLRALHTLGTSNIDTSVVFFYPFYEDTLLTLPFSACLVDHRVAEPLYFLAE